MAASCLQFYSIGVDKYSSRGIPGHGRQKYSQLLFSLKTEWSMPLEMKQQNKIITISHMITTHFNMLQFI